MRSARHLHKEHQRCTRCSHIIRWQLNFAIALGPGGGTVVQFPFVESASLGAAFGGQDTVASDGAVTGIDW